MFNHRLRLCALVIAVAGALFWAGCSSLRPDQPGSLDGFEEADAAAVLDKKNVDKYGQKFIRTRVKFAGSDLIEQGVIRDACLCFNFIPLNADIYTLTAGTGKETWVQFKVTDMEGIKSSQRFFVEKSKADPIYELEHGAPVEVWILVIPQPGGGDAAYEIIDWQVPKKK